MKQAVQEEHMKTMHAEFRTDIALQGQQLADRDTDQDIDLA